MSDRRGDAYLIEMDAIVWPEDEELWPKTYENSVNSFFTNVFSEIQTPMEVSE